MNLRDYKVNELNIVSNSYKFYFRRPKANLRLKNKLTKKQLELYKKFDLLDIGQVMGLSTSLIDFIIKNLNEKNKKKQFIKKKNYNTNYNISRIFFIKNQRILKQNHNHLKNDKLKIKRHSIFNPYDSTNYCFFTIIKNLKESFVAGRVLKRGIFGVHCKPSTNANMIVRTRVKSLRTNLHLNSYFYDLDDNETKQNVNNLIFMSVGYLKKFLPKTFNKKQERIRLLTFQVFAKFLNSVTCYDHFVFIKKTLKNLSTYLLFFEKITWIFFLNPKPFSLLKKKKLNQ